MAEEEYAERLDIVIGMIEHTFPSSHSFSKRYILEFLLDLRKEKGITTELK
jgi:hypothetical protein